MIRTTDLCDAHGEVVHVAKPVFLDFGAVTAFAGRIVTLKLLEDFVLVRERLATPGHGRVLVIDGGGSLRCALLGGKLARLAEQNDWVGIVINGCVRDRREIAACRIGIKALALHPRRGGQRGTGEVDVPVHFADVSFTPGHYLYADEDGVVVTAAKLD